MAEKKDSINSAEMFITVQTDSGLESILKDCAKIIKDKSERGQSVPSLDEAVDTIFHRLQNLHDNGNMREYLRIQLEVSDSGRGAGN